MAWLNQIGTLEGKGLFVQNAAKQMLGVDKPYDMVEVFVADKESVVRNGGDFGSDACFRFIERELDIIISGRHC